jgi:hypothetical protein
LPALVEEVSLHSPRTFATIPTGLAFEVPDLLLLRGWADFHALRMTIELDFCVEGEEYEEVLGLYDNVCAFRRWLIWRSGDGIVVQPAKGRGGVFDTMADVLDMLIPVRE